MEKVQFGYVLLAPELKTTLFVKDNNLDEGEILFTTDENESLSAGECDNDEGIIDQFIQTAGIQIDELFSLGEDAAQQGSLFIGVRPIKRPR
jgi:hypothetical protein